MSDAMNRAAPVESTMETKSNGPAPVQPTMETKSIQNSEEKITLTKIKNLSQTLSCLLDQIQKDHQEKKSTEWLISKAGLYQALTPLMDEQLQNAVIIGLDSANFLVFATDDPQVWKIKMRHACQLFTPMTNPTQLEKPLTINMSLAMQNDESDTKFIQHIDDSLRHIINNPTLKSALPRIKTVIDLIQNEKIKQICTVMYDTALAACQ